MDKKARDILENQLEIPKEEYANLFQIKIPLYNFPSLKIDDDGIFTGDAEIYDKYDKFNLSNGKFCYFPLENPDVEIEKFIINNKLKGMKIDLRINIKGTFSNHQSFIYPLIVGNNPAIYDTLYLTDYFLKHIYMILMAMIIHGTHPDYIAQETYMISMREIEGKYKVSNVEYNYGFLRLIDMISNFVSDNNLRKKQPEIYSEYLECKKQDSIMSAQITYDTIRYTLEDNILTFKKLKEKITITCWKDDEQIPVPSYIKYFQQFFNDYYDDIKKVFPIYYRLENMFRLCAFNAILDNFTPFRDTYETVYFDTYPRSILCSGSAEVVAKDIINDTDEKKKISECRKDFDNGGLICAFAPKLLIRDCYETNLKNFHKCLE